MRLCRARLRFGGCAGSRSSPNFAHAAPEGTPRPKGSQARARAPLLNSVNITPEPGTLHNYRKVLRKFRRCRLRRRLGGALSSKPRAVRIESDSLAFTAILCHAPPPNEPQLEHCSECALVREHGPKSAQRCCRAPRLLSGLAVAYERGSCALKPQTGSAALEREHAVLFGAAGKTPPSRGVDQSVTAHDGSSASAA